MSFNANAHVLRSVSRVVVTACVVAAHLCVLSLFIDVRRGARIKDPRGLPQEVPITARLIAENSDLDTEAASEVNLVDVPVEADSLQAVQFDYPDQDLSGIIGSASAPRPSGYQTMDTHRYAQRVGIPLGQAVTVVLIVEVLRDGSVGSVNIATSGGSMAIDATAIEYVRSLHWIPGTTDHVAQAMRIRFPVTLARAT
jgi:TonB family protein